MREPPRATRDSAEPGEPRKDSSGILEPKRTKEESQRAARDSVRVREGKEDSPKSCEPKETQPSLREPRTRTGGQGSEDNSWRTKPRGGGVYVTRRKVGWPADMTPVLQQLVGRPD